MSRESGWWTLVVNKKLSWEEKEYIVHQILNGGTSGAICVEERTQYCAPLTEKDESRGAAMSGGRRSSRQQQDRRGG